jgi:hypothetical protein
MHDGTKDQINNYLNNKGLHEIFMVVSQDEFKSITMCKTEKEA